MESHTKNQPLFDVVLMIWGDELSLSLVSDALGIEPTLARSKGEVRTLASGNEAVAKRGIWQLNTKDAVESGDISEHIEFILKKIDRWKGELTDIEGVQEAHIYIGVFRDEGSRAAEFEIHPDALRKMSDLGLRLSFVYH